MRITQIQSIASRAVLYFLLAVLAVFMVYPLLWMIAATFKPNLEIFTSVGLVPSTLVTDSYSRGWRSVGNYTFTTYFWNTFVMVIPTVLFTVLSSYITAFGFARFKFRGKTLFFSVMIGCLLLPHEVLIVPRYLLYHTLGWLNTYLPFVVPAAFATYSFFIFLLIQFIRGIPRELDQSARIDGCNSFSILWKIIVPLSKPVLFSATIFQFVWRWNDFFNPLIFINSMRRYPLSLALRMSMDFTDMVAWNNVMAMSLLAIMPPALLYFAAQKYFVEGIATSGLKG